MAVPSDHTLVRPPEAAERCQCTACARGEAAGAAVDLLYTVAAAVAAAVIAAVEPRAVAAAAVIAAALASAALASASGVAELAVVARRTRRRRPHRPGPDFCVAPAAAGRSLPHFYAGARAARGPYGSVVTLPEPEPCEPSTSTPEPRCEPQVGPEEAARMGRGGRRPHGPRKGGVAGLT